MRLWKFGREDIAPVLLMLLLPLAMAAPQLAGWFIADPVVWIGGMTNGFAGGILKGYAHIDPNAGFTAQALGYRAAIDWVHGNVPWWNHYSGVGLPLAGEYQPAAFFPLTLLLLLPDGMTWQLLVLQMVCALATYGLLRQTGAARLAAVTGGVLYEFNGTLAWFSHGPAQALPFLPLLLWGIERAYACAALRQPGGWKLVALAMGLSLLAGFPETAYIDGLLALAWSVTRLFQTEAPLRLDYARRIAVGGTVGICLAAPQLVAFFEYLPESHLGNHGDFAHSHLPKTALIPSLIAPYAYGPIFAYREHWDALTVIWGGIGGYVTVVLLVMAAYGVAARRGALAWMLMAWSVLALAKTFHMEPALSLWNMVPGVTLAAFARYAQPSWELAFVILAAWGLDDLARTGASRRAALIAAVAIGVAALGGALAYGAELWPHLRVVRGLRNSAVASAAWATLTVGACLWLLYRARTSRAAIAVAALLMVDGIFMFAVPTLSTPRGGALNLPALQFLRDNLGLQRFYSLGPIQPNYGALFGIASINHNYLPVSSRWVAWIGAHLDKGADAVVFNGDYARGPGAPTSAQELRRNLAAYQWVGVRYVVARTESPPFAPEDATVLAGKTVRRVYSDGAIDIFELPEPGPYFEALAGRCTIEPRDRGRALVDCDAPATVLRRELFFPGWGATVNGRSVPIAEHRDLFQAVDVPGGKSEVVFSFAPVHSRWAWITALVAAAALAAPLVLRRRRAA